MIWRFGCTAGSGDRGLSRLSARVSSRSVCASQLPPVSPLWALLGHGMNSNLGAVYASASCTSKHVKHDLNQHSTTHGCKSGHNSSTSMLIALSHDRPDSKSYIRTVRRPQVGSYIKGDEGFSLQSHHTPCTHPCRSVGCAHRYQTVAMSLTTISDGSTYPLVDLRCRDHIFNLWSPWHAEVQG